MGLAGGQVIARIVSMTKPATINRRNPDMVYRLPDAAALKSLQERLTGRRDRQVSGKPVEQPQAAKRKPGATKYRSVRTEMDGIAFQSAKEARRYAELKLLQCSGKIADLKLQPVIHCDLNGVHICDYMADFFYTTCKNGVRVVYEDTKGFKTPVYKLKKRLVLALTGIEITEV